MAHKLENMLKDVPSDIDIAQAATPLPIQQIANEAGILDEELEMYGWTKAKMKTMIRVALGQSKMTARPIAAILHMFIYVAFVITQIELIEIVIDGVFHQHRFFQPIQLHQIHNPPHVHKRPHHHHTICVCTCEIRPTRP